MNPLQRTIRLATTDEAFRAALQTDGSTALAQQGLILSSEEMEILSDLKGLFTLPARTMADLLENLYLSCPRWGR